MPGRPIQFAYGIKLMATWMMIPFIVMTAQLLFTEFSHKIEAREVTLLEESFNSTPEYCSRFFIDIDGKQDVASTNVGYKTGDKITVIIMDGDYYKTVYNDDEIKKETTIIGRSIKACDNDFSYFAIGVASALLISFVLTFKSRKAIREEYPKISKVTDIAGIVCCILMSAAFFYAVADNSLDGLATAILGLFLGGAYVLLFTLGWLIDCAAR